MWEKIKDYLNWKWRWENYISFFDIQIFRYLILWFSLVPVIAGLVEQLPDPFPMNIHGRIYDIDLILPFTWQLLWLSSLSFVLAFVVYKWRCPEFILKYNSYSDYQARSHDRRWLSWESYYMWKNLDNEQKRLFIDVICRKGFAEKLDNSFSAIFNDKPVIENAQTVFYFEYDNIKYKIANPSLKLGADHSADQCGLFYEIFGRYTSLYLKTRLFIFSMLSLSLFFFSLAFIQHICNGGEVILIWLKSLM